MFLNHDGEHMPGPYSHLTLLHELMQPGRLESIFPPSSEALAALQACFPYCALGAVSPDYPNLVRGDGTAAARWADAMHCTRACEMISSGIRRIRSAKGIVRDRQFSWLLGYCAHVAADVTIHPIVQAKVGVYAENQRQHRICEMNQDSYIYRRMGLGEIGVSNLFALAVAQCTNVADVTKLDDDIVMLWQGMLKDVYPEQYRLQPPDILSWHREFVAMIAADDRENAAKLFPLAGVISAKLEQPYPRYDMIDRQFIERQLVPREVPVHLHYDEVFDRAAENVANLWKQVEQAVCATDPEQRLQLGDWNLDSGSDEHGRLVFW